MRRVPRSLQAQPAEAIVAVAVGADVRVAAAGAVVIAAAAEVAIGVVVAGTIVVNRVGKNLLNGADGQTAVRTFLHIKVLSENSHSAPTNPLNSKLQ
jgi:hypothetical protein